MNRSALSATLFLLIGLLAPTATSAQTGPEAQAAASLQSEQPTAPATALLAPTARSVSLVDRAPLAPTVHSDSRTPLSPFPQERNRAGIPLMVGGGVAFVAGAIAGGDVGAILMLGGAGVGAYGAYLYFGG